MRATTFVTLLAAIGASQAFPFPRLWRYGRRQMESQMSNVDILRYALTLEHLEDKFYREGLANFTQADFAAAGFDSTFYKNLEAISAHETAHVQFLTTALESAGIQPALECTYAFGVTSVAQFVAYASLFEGVGTSAYLGAAKQIASKAYLQAAGTILTIEARHSSYLRASLAQSPFPQSQEDPLIPDEVHTLAHGFVVSCPTGNLTFPIKAFPGLTVTTPGNITSGSTIGVQTNRYILEPADTNARLFAAFITAAGPAWNPLMSRGDGMNFDVTVPIGVYGQSYLLFNDCNTTVSDDTVVAGPTAVEVSRR